MNNSKGTAPVVFPALITVLVLLWMLNIALGSVSIPMSEILQALSGSEEMNPGSKLIILHSRLPNSLTALMAGAALSASGLMLQSLFRNPLAGPSVLGITSGSSLGVALVMLLTTGLVSLPFWGHQLLVVVAALAGAMGVLLILLLALRKINNNVTILILGLMLSYAVGSVVAILQMFATKEMLQLYVFWGFGSFSGLSWTQIVILASATIIGLAAILPLLKPMNALMLGERYAQSLGVSVSANRKRIIVLTGILAGTVTAFCGPIAFLGMAVPHLARWTLASDNHLKLFPATILMGMIVALFCDLVARMPGTDWLLPLNAVTALLGAPVVLLIILRNNRFKSSF